MDIDRERESWEREAGYPVTAISRANELPGQKSIGQWLSWAHELVSTLGALNGTVGVWPSYRWAVCDAEAMRMVLDTPQGDVSLGLPGGLDEQILLLSRWKKFLGRTYARHPRWGTYLNAAHLAAIGGLERVQAEVAPAVITPLGELTYLQLTPSIETAMSPEAEQKRQALEALMAPILVGAPRPTPTSPPSPPLPP